MRTQCRESEPLSWEWLARELARQIKLADSMRSGQGGQKQETFAQTLAERSSQTSDRQRPRWPRRTRESP